MRVTETKSIGPASGVKKKNRSGGEGDFGSLLGSAEATEESTAPAAAAGIGAIDGILALQGDAPNPNKQQQQRGDAMLKQLDAIRLGLLSGQIPAHAVQQLLSQVKSQKEAATDPALQGIIREIETRAAVELAKLEQL